jgi:hypothetical protein
MVDSGKTKVTSSHSSIPFSGPLDQTINNVSDAEFSCFQEATTHPELIFETSKELDKDICP